MLIGIGGGQFSEGETLKFDTYLLDQIHKESINLLLLSTAAYDDTGYIRRVKRYFKKLNVSVETINLTKFSYTEFELQEMFNRADILYLSGGNTLYALDKWKQYGIDSLIIDAYKRNVHMIGISAGAIAMCHHGYSDVGEGVFKIVDGLNLIDITVCPHYNQMARKSFDDVVDSKKLAIALEDKTAFVFEGETISILKSNEEAKAFILRNNQKKELNESIKMGGYYGV